MIVQPDPHIGRCRNYRSKAYSDGRIETRRCLNYEDVPHQCEFEPFERHVVTSNDSSSQSYTSLMAKRWVGP